MPGSSIKDEPEATTSAFNVILDQAELVVFDVPHDHHHAGVVLVTLSGF